MVNGYFSVNEIFHLAVNDCMWKFINGIMAHCNSLLIMALIIQNFNLLLESMLQRLRWNSQLRIPRLLAETRASSSHCRFWI